MGFAAVQLAPVSGGDQIAQLGVKAAHGSEFVYGFLSALLLRSC